MRIGNKGASTSREQRLDEDVPAPAASDRLVFGTEPLYGDWTVLCVRSSRICVRSLYDVSGVFAIYMYCMAVLCMSFLSIRATVLHRVW